NLPEETAAAFTEDGFFRTGDIGHLDADGYLTITDRKKDLVKTSGGKYIAPSQIEGMFKAICPYTSQAVVIAHGRNFCSLLVTLDPEAIQAWAAGGPLAGRPYEDIVTSPQVREMVAGYVEQLNSKLNRWETIKKFAILPRDLTIEDGEIAPSMKVNRDGVERNFAHIIAELAEGTVARACPGGPARRPAVAPHRVPGRAQRRLDLRHADLPEVEDAGGEHRVGAGGDRRWEVRDPACPTGGDDGDLHRLPHRRDQRQVEPVAGAVGVHGVEQDLPGAELGDPVRPLDGVQPGRPAATVRGDLEPARPAAHVQRQDQHLPAEPVGDLADERRPLHRRRVH